MSVVDRPAQLSSQSVAGDTRLAWYAHRLQAHEGVAWKQVLDVQRPYRRNLQTQHLGRTLDVGCGLGRNLQVLEAGSVGVDHNAAAVATARARGHAVLTVDEWQSSDLRRECAFDSLLLAHVVEHMSGDEALALLVEYLPWVKPGGTVFFICPQERGYASDPTHVTFVDERQLTGLAVAAGLEPERAYSFPFPRVAGRIFTYNEFCLRAVKPRMS